MALFYRCPELRLEKILHKAYAQRIIHTLYKKLLRLYPLEFRERLLLITEGDSMQTPRTNLRLASLISLLFVIPFMIMELVNRRNFNEGFPFPLFALMWILPTIFIFVTMSIVRNVRAGNNILANPIVLMLGFILLVFIALFWAGLLIDQMPCFLGVPNCD